jgi:hypothetical protein
MKASVCQWISGVLGKTQGAKIELAEIKTRTLPSDKEGDTFNFAPVWNDCAKEFAR